MDILQKNKILIWCVAALIFLNLISIGTFWMGILRPPFPPPGDGKGPGKPFIPPEEFLSRELDLSAQQTAQFKKAQEIHFASTTAIMDSVHKLKKMAFQELTSVNPNKEKSLKLFKTVENLMCVVDSVTFDHLNSLRGYCNPKQLEKFDKFLNDVFIMMPPPRVEPGPMPGMGGMHPMEKR